MIKTERFAYFDNDGRYHQVVQVWAQIPATGVWAILSTRPIEVDSVQIPMRPTCPL